MTILAIDPGVNGGIAWQHDEGTASAIAMPETESDIVEELATLRKYGDFKMVAYIEDIPIGMPGKGASMAKLNANAFFIRGVLAALGVRTILVRPVKWQKHYEFGKKTKRTTKKGKLVNDDTAWKNKLRAEAQRRFPHLKVTLKTADALLILDYGRAQL